MTAHTLSPPPADFSIVLGGPLYQLLRRARLSDDALALVNRRIVAAVLITWVPLLVLTAIAGTAWWGRVTVPFLLNADVQTRFLIAMPLLLVAELGVHLRMRNIVSRFVERGLIPDTEMARFTGTVDAAMRLRNSLAVEIALLILIYAVGLRTREYLAVDAGTWSTVPGSAALSAAGWWQALVSVPLFQFLLLRWYFRVFIWARFLWQVSRIKLALNPAHPDGVGGLGFLSTVVYAFTPVLAAHGVLLAGMIADRIFFDDAKLTQFTVEIIGSVGVLVLLVLGPLVVFAKQLADTRRAGVAAYGGLAQHYVSAFDAKWLRGERDPNEPMLGNGDFQSLADLSQSFERIRGMRLVPFTKETVLQLAVITAAPMSPLLLTMISFEDLLKRLLTAVF